MKRLFAIRRSERWPAMAALLLIIALNALMVAHRYRLFTRLGRLGFWSLFDKHFEVSGFDPYTYLTLSQWDVYYEVYRHPLLAPLLYPFYQLNEWLMGTLHINCAIFIVAALLTVSSFYSFIFLRRTLLCVVRLKPADATLLTFFFFSFAYVMLSVCAPDHFGLSMMFLLLTLYVAGTMTARRRPMPAWPTALLFLLTAGITVSNGIKVWIAQWYAHRRAGAPQGWIRGGLLLTLLPILLTAALWQDRTFVQPRMERGHRIEMQRLAKDSALQARREQREQHNREIEGQRLGNSDNKFLRWTNLSVSRWRSAADNLMGESIQLHSDHLLGDIYTTRPVFVSYRNVFPYIVEGLITLLFLAGLAAGRRMPIVRLCFLWFAFDMVIHFVLGFGLNEVYIMTAHWAFIIPIAIAALLKHPSLQRPTRLPLLRLFLFLLTVYLYAYNGSLIIRFMIN